MYSLMFFSIIPRKLGKLDKLMRSLPNYSYSKFLYYNPKAIREQRQQAVKRYWDATR